MARTQTKRRREITSKAAIRRRQFANARSQHGNETAEDYTELIAALISEHGEARTCEIANQLGISHVTAIRTLKRLERDGLVLTQPYKPVVLTKKGLIMAQAATKRHQLVLDLLTRLGIPMHVAALDAEGIEHHLSDTALTYIEKFLKVNR